METLEIQESHHNNKVIVKFKKLHREARVPVKAHECDTGFDVSSVVDIVIPARGSAVVDVGLEVAFITPGFWFAVEGRSGLGFKHGITPHRGIIDNSYRGTCGIKLYNLSDHDYKIGVGDRIAQFVIYKNYNVEMREGETQKTIRNSKGFGSSGK